MLVKKKVGRKSEEEKRDIVLSKMRDPVWFAKNVFGVNYWSKQREIVNAVWENQYVTVKAAHAQGKTHLAANVALTFLFSYPDSIVITTAPTAKQVEDLIWKEIRVSLSNAKMDLGYEITPSSANLTVICNGQKMTKRWYATGFSTNDATKFHGRHAENILFIFDEAAGIAEEIYIGVTGMMTSSNAKLLLIGNPTSTSGGFFNSFKDPIYKKFQMSAYQTPNFTKMGITEDDIYTGAWKEKHDMWIEVNGKEPYPFLATPKWVADHYAKWCKGGVKNALYLSKVEGEFVEQNDDSLIPVNWVEKAFDRWDEIDFDRYKGDVELGVDVAEFGDDNSCVVHKIKDAIKDIHLYSELAIMDFAGIVGGIANRVNADTIKVDTIGIGTGVEGRLAEEGYSTKRVSVSKASKFIKEEELIHMKIHDKIVREMLADGENYHKLRSQMYWYLRMRLDPDKEINPYPIALPRNEMLIEELTGIKYSYTTKGAIALEPKKETKKRLGRSPDIADAVAIAFCPHEFIDDKATPVPKIRIL